MKDIEPIVNYDNSVGIKITVFSFFENFGENFYTILLAISPLLVSWAFYIFPKAGFEISVKGCYLAYFSILIMLAFLSFMFGSKGHSRDIKKLTNNNKILYDKFEKTNDSLNKCKAKLIDLEEDFEDHNNKMAILYQDYVGLWLKGCCRELKLNTDCRVSIYSYKNDEFSILARYSQNPRYREIHALKFPRNQGVISLAWEYGEYTEDSIESTYAENKEIYIQHMCDKFGFSRERVECLEMKSCSYYAFSIREADDTHGVIVFEFDNCKRFNDIDKVSKKSKTIASIRDYCQKQNSFMIKFIRDSIPFDRSSPAKGGNSADRDFLSVFGHANEGGI